ncbi:Chitin binding domain [Trinorchestia longiramus]|nr:Chitin binding domain [Trinorchestia longiramus]
MASKTLCLATVACVLVVISADPLHFPESHSPFGFAADAATIVGVEESTFSCAGLNYGYYADQSLDCKGFHICMPNTSQTGRRRQAYKFSFFCPNQTRFSQDSRTCIAKEQAYPCDSAHLLYGLNSALGQPDEADAQATPRAKSSGLTFPAGASAGSPIRKSVSISPEDQRETQRPVLNLALQDHVSVDDQTREAASLSKDGIASITSSLSKIDDDVRTSKDGSLTAEIDNSHTLSRHSNIDDDEGFILTSQSPSTLGHNVNEVNQNASNRLKGARLNEKSRQISDGVNESSANKQVHHATEERNTASAPRLSESVRNVPRGRKVSGSNDGIVISVNSLKNDSEEPVAEPEPEPEPVSKATIKERAKDPHNISSKNENASNEEVIITNVQSSAQLTSTSPIAISRQNTEVNIPLLVGPRPSLSGQGVSNPRTQTLYSGQKSTEHVGTLSARNDLTDEIKLSLQAPDRALPSLTNNQKLPQNVLSNLNGNFHQVGFQIIKHDQSTNLNRGQTPLILSPLAKAQKIPSSLSLPSFDNPTNQQFSGNSQQNLPVPSAGLERGPANTNLNNDLYTNSPRGEGNTNNNNNRQRGVIQINSDVEVSDKLSSSARQSNNNRGNRLYGGNNVQNQHAQAISVASPGINSNTVSSDSDRNSYLPQNISPHDGETSPDQIASFRVSDRTASRQSNDNSTGKRKIITDANNKQNAVPPPPLFENHNGKIKTFEAQQNFNDNEKELSSSKQNAPSLSLNGNSNRSYLPTQTSSQSVHSVGKIPGFSAGVRRINGKIIEGSALPRTTLEISQKNNQIPSTRTLVTATGKQATESVSSTPRTSQKTQITAPTPNRARGRGQDSSSTSSQIDELDTSKKPENIAGLRTQVTSSSVPASILPSSSTTDRAGGRRSQGAGRGNAHNPRTTTLENSPVRTPIDVRPASRNLRARGNHNSLLPSNQLHPKEFEPSKGHEVRTTHDLEILLDEDLDAATASLLAGIQPPKKSRHKKDSSSNEAPVLSTESDTAATVNEPQIELGIKSPPITGTVIPQRLFNPRQKTPSNRRATPGSINLGTVGSITTAKRNGEVNPKLLPTTTTTTTTPKPRTTRVPRSTTERSTTTRRPVNDKRGSVKFTPSPYLDLSWLGPTIRNRITNHLKKITASTRGSRNSEISNSISDPLTRSETDNNINPIDSTRRSSSTGFSLSKSNKNSHVKTLRQQTSSTPILKSPIPKRTDDLDVAETTTKPPNLVNLSNRRRTRNHRVKLRVNPVDEDAEKGNTNVPSVNSKRDALLKGKDVIHRSKLDGQSKPSLLSREVHENTPNEVNGHSESFLTTTETAKTVKEDVNDTATNGLSAELGSRKLTPEDSSTVTNLLETSSKNEPDIQSTELTTQKNTESESAENVNNEKEINSKIVRTPTSFLPRVVDIPEPIKTQDSNSTKSKNVNASTPANSEKVEENSPNIQSRARNSRRKVVRLNKRPASNVSVSSSSKEKILEESTAVPEDSLIQTSKKKPTERTSRKFKQENNSKSGTVQTREVDKKLRTPGLENNLDETGKLKSENETEVSRAPKVSIDKISLPITSTRRKILLPAQGERLSKTVDQVTDEITSANIQKNVTLKDAEKKIPSSEVNKNEPVEVDARQDEKPSVISRRRSRTHSRGRQTRVKAQDSNSSSLAVVTTSEKPQNLQTSNAPTVNRLRSRRISTRRRLITAVPTTTAGTNDRIKTDDIENNNETNSKNLEDSSSPNAIVTGSVTEGTLPSQSSIFRRKSRTRFTTAVPASVKDVEKLITEDNSISKVSSTTEILPVSLTNAPSNGRRRFKTKAINSATEAPKKAENSGPLDEFNSASRSTTESSVPAPTSPKENRRRLRTRVAATKPDLLTTSQNSTTSDTSLDISKDFQNNISPENRRGFRRTSRRRLITNKISPDDDNPKTTEAKEPSERADEQDVQENVKAEVKQLEDTINFEKSKVEENNNGNRTTTISSVTLETTTTASPVNFANLFKINTANHDLEDEIQTISESQNTHKTAVRRRKINAVGEKGHKTGKYSAGKDNEQETQNLELSLSRVDSKHSAAENENAALSGAISFRRPATKILDNNPVTNAPSIQESQESTLQNKITSSKRKIEAGIERSTKRSQSVNRERNRRLVRKVKLSKSEVPNDSLNNVYETLRSARSNRTVKSNELRIPGLKPGLNLRVVGTSVKKSVSTSSATSSSPEKQDELPKDGGSEASFQFSDSPQEKPTKTRRKFASRRPVNRKVNLSEELSVPQAAESRAFRTTIIRRKLNDES